jgi:hypothetical protein
MDPWLRSAGNNETDSATPTNGGVLEYATQESKNFGLLLLALTLVEPIYNNNDRLL